MGFHDSTGVDSNALGDGRSQGMREVDSPLAARKACGGQDSLLRPSFP